MHECGRALLHDYERAVLDDHPSPSPAIGFRRLGNKQIGRDEGRKRKSKEARRARSRKSKEAKKSK
jgi:hypothetical protein